MKKFTSIIIMLIICCMPVLAENAAEMPEDGAGYIHNLYEIEETEVYETGTVYTVNFSEAFALDLPANWQSYELTEEQVENGSFACFGDGDHFMFVAWEEDKGDYKNMENYAMHLGLNDMYSGIFVAQFGGQDFALYTDYESMSSDCATIIPGVGIYTFYFYPLDGNMEFAQTVIDTMDTFRLLEASE